MPLPEWKKRVAKAQSFARRLRANLLNADLIRPFGPPGASARVTASEAPLGSPPRKDEWNDNPLVEERSNVSATRPRHDRQRGDLAR